MRQNQNDLKLYKYVNEWQNTLVKLFFFFFNYNYNQLAFYFIFLGNVNECCTVLVKNLIKESIYGKRKKNN